MPSEPEWAWVAGVFAGCGSILAVNGGRDLRLALHTTDGELAARYAEILGARLLGPYPAVSEGLGRRQSYRCNLNGRRAVAALAAMQPWLSARQQARLVELGFGAIT